MQSVVHKDNFGRSYEKGNEDHIQDKLDLSSDNLLNLNSYRRVKNSIETNNSQIFKNLTFFVDISLGGTDISDCLIKILESQGGKISKRIKGTNYVIFNDGKKTTIEKALEHDIKLVSPTWIHESTLNGKLINIDNYIIKKSFTDLFLDNINKRKFKEISYGGNKIPSKTRKTTANNIYDFDIETANTQSESNDYFKKKFHKDIKVKKEEDKDKENKVIDVKKDNKKMNAKSKDRKEDNKRINTKSLDRKEESKEKTKREKSKKKNDNKKQTNKVTETQNNELINITCVDASIFEIQKLSNICSKTGLYKYFEFTAESIKNINLFFLKKDTNMKADIKRLFLLLYNEVDLYDVKYIYDSSETNKQLDIQSYKIEKTKYLEGPNKERIGNINDYFEERNIFDKYKFYFHETLKNEEKEENKIALKTLTNICQFLGGKIVDNLRMSDICIINQKEKENFPPFIKILNQEFLIDSIKYMKFPDIDDKKYTPFKSQKRKIKNK